MTGFGKTVLQLDNRTINIEMRSVNSKNFDFIGRMPSHFREKEPQMRKIAQTILVRGKIELSLSETNSQSETSVEINQFAMKKHFESIKEVAQELNIETGADLLGAIMRVPDVLTAAVSQIDDKEWELIFSAVTEACNAMDAFRIQEGAALQIDFEKRIENIRKYQEQIVPFEESRIQLLRDRFEKDLSGVVDYNQIDRNRFEQEIMFYLEKLDITEEKVRLSQHLDYFQEIIKEGYSQGKKLNFINQEIGRELNTLGSKANHAQIQKLIVSMKDELEKIKEQMLNIL